MKTEGKTYLKRFITSARDYMDAYMNSNKLKKSVNCRKKQKVVQKY